MLGLDNGKLAEQLKLDIVVPVRGYKRCVDYTEEFGVWVREAGGRHPVIEDLLVSL